MFNTYSPHFLQYIRQMEKKFSRNRENLVELETSLEELERMVDVAPRGTTSSCKLPLNQSLHGHLRPDRLNLSVPQSFRSGLQSKRESLESITSK